MRTQKKLINITQMSCMLMERLQAHKKGSKIFYQNFM